MMSGSISMGISGGVLLIMGVAFFRYGFRSNSPQTGNRQSVWYQVSSSLISGESNLQPDNLALALCLLCMVAGGHYLFGYFQGWSWNELFAHLRAYFF